MLGSLIYVVVEIVISLSKLSHLINDGLIQLALVSASLLEEEIMCGILSSPLQLANYLPSNSLTTFIYMLIGQSSHSPTPTPTPTPTHVCL